MWGLIAFGAVALCVLPLLVKRVLARRILIVVNEEGQLADSNGRYPVSGAIQTLLEQISSFKWGLRTFSTVHLHISDRCLRGIPSRLLQNVVLHRWGGPDMVLKRKAGGTRRHYHLAVLLGALDSSSFHQLQDTVEYEILVCGERVTCRLKEAEKMVLHRSSRIETFVGGRNRLLARQATREERRRYHTTVLPSSSRGSQTRRETVRAFLVEPKVFLLNFPDFAFREAAGVASQLVPFFQLRPGSSQTTEALSAIAQSCIQSGGTREREEEEEDREEQGGEEKGNGDTGKWGTRDEDRGNENMGNEMWGYRTPSFYEITENYVRAATPNVLDPTVLNAQEVDQIYAALCPHFGEGLSGDEEQVAQVAAAVWKMSADGSIRLPFETSRQGGYYADRATIWSVNL